MNDSGKVEVELRLALEQMKKDIKVAADMLRAGLSGANGEMAAGAAKAGKEMEGLERKTKKTTDALKDLKKAAYDAWKASLPAPVVSISNGANKSYASGPGAVLNQGVSTFIPPSLTSSLVPPQAAGGGAIPPPISPPKGWSPAPAGGGGSGMVMLSILAQVGAIMAGIRSAFLLLKSAINIVIAPFRMLASAADAARQAYASSLRSGMPLEFGIRTGMLASVLGVSQDDVLQYAKAIEVLNSKMKFSIQTFQETNRTLTMVSWGMKAANASFAAFVSQMAADLAPAINQFLNLLRDSFDAMAKSSIVSSLTWLVKMVFHLANVLAGAVSLLVQAFELIASAVIDSIQYFIRQVKNSIARMTGGSIDTTDVYKETKEKAEILARTAKDVFGRGANTAIAPEPSGNASRPMSSAWEKMGLVLGVGGQNHAAQTAANTKRMAGLLEKMVGKLESPDYSAGLIPQSLPSSP